MNKYCSIEKMMHNNRSAMFHLTYMFVYKKAVAHNILYALQGKKIYIPAGNQLNGNVNKTFRCDNSQIGGRFLQ